MIHIGTSHYRDDRWIEPQLRYLERYTHEPHRLYASLDGIPERHHALFHHVEVHSDLATDDPWDIRLQEKLNRLTAEMVDQAEPGDLLVFMHGDAFPIAEWIGPARRMLAGRPLAAVHRRENFEPIPHPSFCVTTAGFWADIGGQWSWGSWWDSAGRPHTDIGASLMDTLNRRGIAWHPIERTNRVNPHPVFFGVYGDIVYHHGAGFRTPLSRRDAVGYERLPAPLRHFGSMRRNVKNRILSRHMFRRIREDEDFHLALTGGNSA